MSSQRGFTIVELMVAMLLFSIIGMGLVVFTTHALQGLGAESRVSISALELKNAIGLLSSELKMSSAISPYLPGSDVSLTNCAGAVTVTPTTVTFLISEDDSTATSTSGIRPYFVGYSYDSAAKQLLRGEIQAPGILNCTLPSGSPTSATYAKPLAERVTQIDIDGNGTLEPIFSLSGDILSINLGVEVAGPSGSAITQRFSTKAYMRVHS